VKSLLTRPARWPKPPDAAACGKAGALEVIPIGVKDLYGHRRQLHTQALQPRCSTVFLRPRYEFSTVTANPLGRCAVICSAKAQHGRVSRMGSSMRRSYYGPGDQSLWRAEASKRQSGSRALVRAVRRRLLCGADVRWRHCTDTGGFDRQPAALPPSASSQPTAAARAEGIAPLPPRSIRQARCPRRARMRRSCFQIPLASVD